MTHDHVDGFDGGCGDQERISHCSGTCLRLHHKIIMVAMITFVDKFVWRWQWWGWTRKKAQKMYQHVTIMTVTRIICVKMTINIHCWSRSTTIFGSISKDPDNEALWPSLAIVMSPSRPWQHCLDIVLYFSKKWTCCRCVWVTVFCLKTCNYFCNT